MGQAVVYPRIPDEPWRRDAACSFSADVKLWDADVTGETVQEKRERHRLAIAVCEACPVKVECASCVDLRFDEGVRAGVVLPTRDAVSQRNWRRKRAS